MDRIKSVVPLSVTHVVHCNSSQNLLAFYTPFNTADTALYFYITVRIKSMQNDRQTKERKAARKAYRQQNRRTNRQVGRRTELNIDQENKY